MKRRALIVEDGSGVNVVAAARSLGRAGWDVGLGVPDGTSRAARSRFVSRLHPVPRPEEGLLAFTAGLNKAVEAHGYEVVFPGDDVEMLALSSVRSQVSALVPYAAHSVVLRAVDKMELTICADEVGMSTPRTRIATPEAIAGCDQPVLVKSRLHWTPGATNANRHLPVRLCTNATEVRSRVREIEAFGGSAVLQQPVPGDLMAFSAVVDKNGGLRAACQQKTLLASLRRTSVRAVTTEVDAELQDQVVALLARLGWFGLANMQFIRPPDGPPHLIDFNGRYYGSLALAIGAGADLPAVWAALAAEPPTTAGTSAVAMARPGVRFHAMEEDLQRARHQRRGGLGRDMLDVLSYAPGATHATWCVRDLGPASAVMTGIRSRAVRRLRSRLPAGEQADE